MRHPDIRFALLIGGSLLSLSLLGCSGSQETKPPTPAEQAAQKAGHEATLTQQVKSIDDNSHMPPEAKEAAKANLRMGQQVDMSHPK